MQFELANHAHDAELRRLLRDNPMPGMISLSFEREPSFFMAAEIEGDVHQTIAACEPEHGRVVGLGARSSRMAYLNGAEARLGYLGQLRIDAAHRGRAVLAAGWLKVRELHEQDPIDSYVTTIIADNVPARRALEKDRPNKPCYRSRGELHTLALVPRTPPLRSHLRRTKHIERGRPDMLPDIAACLQRNYKRYQFAPVWTADSLADAVRCRGLSSDSFLVTLRNGRVVGCLATWDQQSFKQSVVRGYGRAIRVARPLVNAASRVLPVPRLPSIGETIPHAYLSHVAVDDDDPAVLIPMIERALDEARSRKLAYLALGLVDHNPMLAPVRRAFLHIDYRAIVYVVHFPDGEAKVKSLDHRTPHLELATL